MMNGGDEIDLHFERGALLILGESGIGRPAGGVIGQAEENSAVDAPQRLEQILRKRQPQFDMTGPVIERFEAEQFSEW